MTPYASSGGTYSHVVQRTLILSFELYTTCPAVTSQYLTAAVCKQHYATANRFLFRSHCYMQQWRRVCWQQLVRKAALLSGHRPALSAGTQSRWHFPGLCLEFVRFGAVEGRKQSLITAYPGGRGLFCWPSCLQLVCGGCFHTQSTLCCCEIFELLYLFSNFKGYPFTPVPAASCQSSPLSRFLVRSNFIIP